MVKMKKIVLFSPTGYVGSFVKLGLQKEKDIQLYEMTRDNSMAHVYIDYDILIYSASITSERHETAEKYVQDNVVTAVAMVDFCKKHNIKRIIYCSSDEIYGDLNTDMVTEQTIMVNPNLYATTKYLAEKIIMESGIPSYILRLPGIVGKVWKKNFIYNLMEKIKNNEKVELYNLDRKFNNLVDIDDLVRFITDLCKRQDSVESEIFLLGNSESMDLQAVVSHIKNLYHSTSVICNVHTDTKRCFTLDVTQAEKYGYSSKKIKTILDELYQIREESDAALDESRNNNAVQ